MSYLP